MATDTFNPDADPETSTVDGSGLFVLPGSGGSWNTIINADGSESVASEAQDNDAGPATIGFGFNAAGAIGSGTGYKRLMRSIFTFNIPTGKEVESALLKLHINDTAIALGNMNCVVVEASTASNTAIALSDCVRSAFTLTQLSDLVSISGMSTGAYNTFTLNTSGKDLVQTGGIVKLGVILDNDRTDTAPSGNGDNDITGIAAQFADGANAPILEVTFISTGGAALLQMLMSWGGIFAISADMIKPLLQKTVTIEAS